MEPLNIIGFKKKIEARKNAYTGDIVKECLEKAYLTGMEDLGKELQLRFENESKMDKDTRAGLRRAIGILLEYGS